MDCDICGRKIHVEEYSHACRNCLAEHCAECLKEAEKRGDYSADGDFDGERYIDCSYHPRCLLCREEVEERKAA